MRIVRIVCVPRVPWKGVTYGIWKKRAKIRSELEKDMKVLLKLFKQLSLSETKNRTELISI